MGRITVPEGLEAAIARSRSHLQPGRAPPLIVVPIAGTCKEIRIVAFADDWYMSTVAHGSIGPHRICLASGWNDGRGRLSCLWGRLFRPPLIWKLPHDQVTATIVAPILQAAARRWLAKRARRRARPSFRALMAREVKGRTGGKRA